MRIFQQFGLGIKTFFSALSFIHKHRLYHYFIYPFILSLILLIGFYNLQADFYQWIKDWLYQLTNLSENAEGWTGWIGTSLQWLLKIVVVFTAFIVFYNTNKYLVFILLSPLLALLSEKTEELQTGKTYPFKWGLLLRDIWRGIRIALRNFAIEMTLAGIGALTSLLLPIIGPFVGTFLVATSCYYYGFGTIDYVLERRRYRVSESFRAVRQHRGIALGNGFMFWLLFAVPVIGYITAPILATVGAALAMEKALKNEVEIP